MSTKNNIAPIDKSQIVKIHIAKSQLKLSRDQYEDILSGFINPQGNPCSSSKELNKEQADALLRLFVKLGWKEQRRGRTLKYEQHAGRDSIFANPKQMRRIDALWNTSPAVREKTDLALNHFIKRVAGVDHISFLLAKDVHKVIKAINQL